MIRITRAGKLYILITIFLALVAANTGLNLVYLIVSALLSFMIISGILGKANISSVDIGAVFPDELYAARPFPFKVSSIVKRRYLPGFMLRLHVDEESVFFPFINVRSESTEYITYSFAKRGIHRVDNFYLCSAFPFNFFVRCRKIKKSFDIIVFPEPKKCNLANYLKEEVRASGELPVDKIGHHPETISIRDYIRGDPMKYINWKATAKTDKLKTRELSSTSFYPVVIDFNDISIENIEEKISCITYIVMQLYSKGIPFGLKIRDKTFLPEVTRSHKISVLKELALYGSKDTG